MQIRNFDYKKLLKKRYILALILVVLIVLNFLHKGEDENTLVDSVRVSNLTQSVLATGKVVSETDLDLSFKDTGIVKKINVKVGDKVKRGQALAYLDQGSLLASLTQARGALAIAEAKYESTILGSSDEEIALAKVLLENAKSEYDETKEEYDAKVDKESNILWLEQANEKHKGVLDDYNIAYTARNKALSSAQSLIDQRQAELDVKLAGATDPEIALAKAEVLKARGEVELAEANLENSIIRAPASGTITKVDIELGELANANEKSITLEDVDNLYIEAKINEANITIVKVGDPVSIVYDSLGPENSYQGSVISVDPSSTIEDGVVNYKVKIALSEESAEISKIKPGMNADIKITTFEKENALVAPLLSIESKDGESFLKLLDDPNKKTYNKIPVKIGVKGDGNLVEILEGANDGDRVVVSTK